MNPSSTPPTGVPRRNEDIDAVRTQRSDQSSGQLTRPKVSWRRLGVLIAALLGFDMATKTAAQFQLPDRELLLVDGWGVTYLVHDGLWVWTTIPLPVLIVVHVAMLAIWVLMVRAWRWYSRWYRESLAVDLAMAALTVTAFGNGIDRLLVGGARDWWITPIAVANFADVAHWIALAALLWEGWRFPPSRDLARLGFHLDPRKHVPPPHQRPRGTPQQELSAT